MERGAAPDNGAAVERREAPPPSHGGGTPRKRSGRADRKACPKGVSQTPWRLPALHPLASRGKEKGEGRARVHKNRAGGALGDRLVCKLRVCWANYQHYCIESARPVRSALICSPRWRPVSASTAPLWLASTIACAPRPIVAPAPPAP